MPSNEVLTLGTFDLFHAGHAAFLRACKNIGWVTVAVNSSEYAAEFKEPPIGTTEERVAVVDSILGVVATTVNHGNCKKVIEQWAKHRPGTNKFLAIGEDWMPAHHYCRQLGITVEWLRSRDITLIFIAEACKLHTTEIRERCQKPPSQ